MVFCDAIGCNNRSSRKSATQTNEKISFHCFPKDAMLRKTWILNIRRQGFQLKKTSKICSAHFEECFLKTCSKKVVLTENAVPTIFNFQAKQNMTKIVRKRAYRTADSAMKSSKRLKIEEPYSDTYNDDLCREDMNDSMETSPIECEVQIKTEPVDHDITVNQGLYNGPIGDEQIFPVIHCGVQIKTEQGDHDITVNQELYNGPIGYEEIYPGIHDNAEDKVRSIPGNSGEYMFPFTKVELDYTPGNGYSQTEFISCDIKAEIPSMEYKPTEIQKGESLLKQYITSVNTEKQIESNEESNNGAISIKDLKGKIKERPFSCEYCSYKAARNGLLQTHIRSVHNRERPFSCEYCSYKASQNVHLQNHIKSVHNKENPFSCEHCSYKATENRSLKRHIMSVHNMERPFSCEHCSYKATTNGNLQLHIKSIHNKEKHFSSEHCSYKAAQKVDLLKHIKSIHNE